MPGRLRRRHLPDAGGLGRARPVDHQQQRLQLKFTYANNDDPVATPANFHLWSTVASAIAINNAVEYCDPNANSCSLTNAWPTATIGSGTITDALNRTTTYTTGVGSTYSIKRPGSASADVTWNLSGATVTSAVRDGVTYNYTFADVGNTRTTTVTDPNGKTRVYVGDKTTFRISSLKDELNRTTSYTYDSNQRLKRITQPEGNYVDYTYDARGNVTTTTNVAKAGSGLANIVTSAAFPSTCTNAKTCNKPTSTTDARGSVTNYTWDTNHGGVKTVTAPAATAGGIRPKVTYTYATKQAYYKQSAAGSPAASGINEYKLTQVDACQTLATCTGGSLSDQVKSTLAWGPQTAGTANNLLPVSVSSGNGTGTLTATTAYTYDTIGNRLTVDGPLTGTADTTRYRYDAARQVVGIVGPDPDGGGIRKNLAQRVTYNPQGQVTNLELGNVNSQSDPDWALFAPAQNVASTYDTHARLTLQQLQSGATTYAVTQTSYDSLGRLDCSAVRMNSALFGSLPASACTLGTTGTQGPDRISQRVYDDASEILQQKVAVGTADAATDTAYTYSSNGKVTTLKDGENNLTTFVYDGFDRLSQTQFPNTPKGSGTSNPGDYEQLTYDPNGNVTSRRLRDGTSIAYTIDFLNRPTLKDLPGTEPDVTYGYDLLGRLLSANQTGSNLTFTYDALGRKLTEAGPLGTATSTWNLDGTRATLALPGGGITETYDRDVTGLVTKVRENGASSGIGVLATYTYDNLSRRTGVANGNGTSSSTSFDPVSRLASLTQDLAGTLNDLTVTISAYNAASQIVTQSRSNDLYAWTGHGNGSTDTVTNGLNQLATVGGVAATHDARGNLTLDPASGNSYGYSSENLLTSATVGGNAVTLAYDPLLRLTQVAGTATTRFGYDGLDTTIETDSAGTTILRRYAPGDGVDQPIVWYEGGATADRRWLHADERGSIVAVSDASGNMLGINTYDEFGKPGAPNIGRFQYTGQKWIGEIGVYDYKARMYAPALGRFLQTDPIGYGSSPNIYAYVRGDPLNLIDPLGLLDAGYRPYVNPVDALPDPGEILVIGDLLAAAFAAENAAAAAAFAINGAGYGPLTGTVGNESSGGEKDKVACNPTPQQLHNSGTVSYSAQENTATYGLLYSHVEGRFTTTGGYSGWFETSAKGLFVGKGTGVGMGTGTSQSLWTFTGTNYNIVGSLGPVSISDNFSTSGHVGSTDVVATPGLGIGVTKSTTTIRDVQCPASSGGR